MTTGEKIGVAIGILAIVSIITLAAFALTEDHRVSIYCKAAGYDRYRTGVFTDADLCIKTTAEEQTESVLLDTLLKGEPHGR